MADLRNTVEVYLKGPRGQAARQILQEKNMLVDREDEHETVKWIGEYRFMCVYSPNDERSYIFPIHQVFGEVTGLVKVPDDHYEQVNDMMETLVTYMKNEFPAVTWQAYRDTD